MRELNGSRGVPWDFLLLLCLVVAPAYGGLSALLVLLLAFFAMLAFGFGQRVNIPPERSLVFWVFLAYFAYFFIGGAVLNRDISAALGAMKGNMPLLLLAVFCLLAPSDGATLSASKVGWWCTLAALITAILAVLIYAFIQLAPELAGDLGDTVWHRGGRLRMFSRNALMFASMFVALIFLSFLGFRRASRNHQMITVSTVLVGLFMVGVWAQARAALLLSVPLCLLAIWYVRPTFKRVAVTVGFVLFAASLLYVFLMPFQAVVDAGANRLYLGVAALIDSDASIDRNVAARLTMYRLGLEAASHSWLWGYGFQNRFEAIVPLMPAAGVHFVAGHLHNDYISHLVAGGVPGLLIFLLFLSLPVLIVWRRASTSKDLVYAAGVALCVTWGTALSTAVLGHFVHTNFYGLLFVLLTRIAAYPLPQPAGGLGTCLLQGGVRSKTSAI